MMTEIRDKATGAIHIYQGAEKDLPRWLRERGITVWSRTWTVSAPRGARS